MEELHEMYPQLKEDARKHANEEYAMALELAAARPSTYVVCRRQCCKSHGYLEKYECVSLQTHLRLRPTWGWRVCAGVHDGSCKAAVCKRPRCAKNSTFVACSLCARDVCPNEATACSFACVECAVVMCRLCIGKIEAIAPMVGCDHCDESVCRKCGEGHMHSRHPSEVVGG